MARRFLIVQYKLFENSLNDKSQIIKTVLINRGIQNPQEYLNLNEDCINDYNDLDNIDKAIECFEAHIERGDEVGILVDTDP